MTNNFRDVTDSEFKEAIATGKTVILDVWAEWCGPCKMLLPLIEQAAADHPDIEFLKLNADKTELMAELQVRGVPTLLKYEKGILVDRKVGSMSKNHLANFIGA